MTLCAQGRHDKRRRMINLSISNAVDGIIYFPDSGDADIAELMRNNNVPFVLIDREIVGVSADIVRCDDYVGGSMAADYLYRAGHRAFMYIGSSPGNGAQPLRQSGFVDTLLQKGVAEKEIRIIGEQTIYPAMESGTVYNVLYPVEDIGIFAFNDQIAYFVLNALRENKHRVPEQISIVGFDYIRDGLMYLPPLTSIASAGELLVAEKAVALLLSRIEDPEKEYRSEVLPVTIHEPESTMRKLMDKEKR